MSISDRTRKVLWARSGNMCAICKQALVVNATTSDPECVVGEECHILSGKANGPRYDPEVKSDRIDSYLNLLLLCRVHHKMVDDQQGVYTAEVLKQIRTRHEEWVSDKLEGQGKPSPNKIRRIPENIPKSLALVTTGKELLNIVLDACAYSFDHDQLSLEEEVDIVAGFLQNAEDWGEIGSTLGVGERVRVGVTLDESIKRLQEAGFRVFGAREVQQLEGGSDGPTAWPVAILRVTRVDKIRITKTFPGVQR